MRKLIVAAFVSLDGVMQAPGGPQEDNDGGFRYGGWVAPYFDETVGAAVGEFMSGPFDLLLGRRTWDIFAAHWPHVPEGHPDRALADVLNGVSKYVATHRPDSLGWAGSHSLGSDVIDGVRRLKGDGSERTLVTQGSTELVHQLLAADVVDEIRTLAFPVVLGPGKRLFDGRSLAREFKLIKSVSSSTGVVISTYERAGAVKTGDFSLDQPTEPQPGRDKVVR
ncbi:MAG: dihydrofolate reductase family protein [Caulobacteraceae bacterium]|nr:dihydrofolate reductase family protein [Caulobacteraceae bacterium]